MQDCVKEFLQLITYGHNCFRTATSQEAEAVDVVRYAAVELQRQMWLWSAGVGMREGLFDDAPVFANTELPGQALTKILHTAQNTICVMLDLSLHLDNKITLRLLRDVIAQLENKNNVLVMIDSTEQLPDVIRTCARPFEIPLPDEEKLRDIVMSTIRKLHNKKPFKIGISKQGLDAVIRNLRGLTERQAKQILTDCIADDDMFADSDINQLLASKRNLIQRDGLLEYIQTPLTLDEIGGMGNIKKWLSQRKDAFTQQAEQFGLKNPRGILILGVQGAGKSLCAKAVATAWQKPLFRLDPGVLFASYVGQSESNLRSALRQTEAMSPVVLWIDEIEKGFASAASQSTDGGLSKRMFGTFLTWMQERTEPVFVIATANDIEALPPELLRKGRFDEIFFVDLPAKSVRRKIFEIHIKKCSRDPKNFDLGRLASESEGFSGAEIEQAVNSALYEAFADKSKLSTEYIVSAVRQSPPLSVTMAEAVESLRAWAKGRCVPAD